MYKEFYSWGEFEKDILYLNSKIQYTQWIPDHIVGVKRGGLVAAVTLSHLLFKPMNVITYQTRDGNKNPCVSDLLGLGSDAKILIVDDICDTGETFEKLSKETKNFKNIKYCSIYYNIRQDFRVDYFAKKIDREKNKSWIVFPWELIKSK